MFSSKVRGVMINGDEIGVYMTVTEGALRQPRWMN